MHSIPSSPPVIEPVKAHENRPLWSVMIPVYNCARFLPETLTSVLLQGIPEQDMQIEVIDDASTDADVAAIVQQIGKGRIAYFRQSENLGNLRNFETCINRSRGRLLHILHGDDRIRKGYYQRMERLFNRHPAAGAAFCRYSYIDENGNRLFDQKPETSGEGILPDWLPRIGQRQLIQYVAITVRRDVYEKLGSFYGLTYGEDWEMWVRIARYYPVAYTPRILADYRKHSQSISGNKFLTGQNSKDIVQTMMMIQDLLPAEQKKSILKESKKFYAFYGLKVARQMWNQLRNIQAVHAQVKQALFMHQSLRLFLRIAELYYHILLDKKQR